MSASATPRVLQPAAWRRAIAPIVVAVLVLSVVLQEPVAELLPDGTPRVLVFVAIAVPIVAAVVLGLSAAYPRVVADADGALRVRGRVVRPSEIVAARRSVSAGGGSAYLVLTLRTDAGRGIRVLVAGVPIRGLDPAQLGVLREVVAASAIPVVRTSESERAFLSENVLASGRRVDVDRGLVLRELDELRGVRFAGLGVEEPLADAADAADAVDAAVLDVAPSAPETAAASASSAQPVDDTAVERELAAATRSTALARRIAFWVLAVATLGAAGLLALLVVMESTGVDFGAADEDPLTAAMSIAIGVALLAGIAWATAADVDDARRRAESQRWLAFASEAQRRRGLPDAFHAAWLRAPGGRMGAVGLMVLAIVAFFAVIGGPVALAQGYGPVPVGVAATIVGVALSALALWGWIARRRAHARRVEWLVEAAGERARRGLTGDDPLSR
ncbi:hypothetical protein H4J02_08090 [Protaetiibacter sp. SSC-01]|uniref:hypothetical protein n=1 Tax=Protaetiibacter sp. SSC-01 TaxID=2759943 RepID=UPI001656EC19|nr:hypothetical protein [Protaetiibacter sp. SSC-01]QNO36489.1 hypothetical protein H4J02_08090 [Protaetiibacter sp. SSC-01]